MKRFFVSLALALFATAAFAQAADRDVLVTLDGTVYTVDQGIPSSSSGVAASNILELAIQKGSETPQYLLVPESVSAGRHFGSVLAYDADSKTLFVLWTHMRNATSSELLLASYRDGKWQPAVSIDYRDNSARANLRLSITRRVPQLQKDGTYADASALILHAVWWDSNAHSEEAKYAMLPIENGALSPASVEIHSLSEFVSGDETIHAVNPDFNAEILRHPAIVSSPMESSVDIVFGDTAKNSFHRVTLHPIAEVRLHIPVGIGSDGPGGGKPPMSLAAPPSFSSNWKGPVSVINRGDRLVFANAGDTSLNYITYANGTWSDLKSIAIDNKFPAEAALAAVDKMVSTQ
ncbi:MAG TPA: hypothetical protein VGQ65_11320 [Thermoanaerobaculia bacterium]|jgi:hypothetical protein|nr:hypothetical protein [Thermoanaerobaculia bacterium]